LLKERKSLVIRQLFKGPLLNIGEAEALGDIGRPLAELTIGPPKREPEKNHDRQRKAKRQARQEEGSAHPIIHQ
jgi:hypothetical protein